MFRFDHHTIDPATPTTARTCPDGRTVIYLAQTLRTALAEVFNDPRTATICPGYRVAALHVDADCRVQDLTGPGCMAIGAVPALCSADVDRELSQSWARAIHEDQPAGAPIAGVMYRSAHDEGLCLALFERSPTLLEVSQGSLRAEGIPLLDITDQVTHDLDAVNIQFAQLDAKDCARCCLSPAGIH